ncbi:hypothetical protein QUB47_36375 [Microcoleus sp. AT9_B5]
MSIISFDIPNVVQLFCLLRSCHALDVQLLSIARYCYRSPVTVIDRPQLLSIARYCYRSPATIIDRPSPGSDRGATPIEHTTY